MKYLDPILENVSYKSIHNVVAFFAGLSALTIAFAPNTVAKVLNLQYVAQDAGSWFNSNRLVSLMLLSTALLALWSRFIGEVYAQKIIMRFYSVFFGLIALNNFFGGIEASVAVHSPSIGLLGVLFFASFLCWAKSRGLEPNIKAINSISKISLIGNEDSSEAADTLKESSQ